MPPKSSAEVAVVASTPPEVVSLLSSSSGGAQPARADAAAMATSATNVERTFTGPPLERLAWCEPPAGYSWIVAQMRPQRSRIGC